VEYLANSVGAHSELLTLTPSAGVAASVVHLDGIELGPEQTIIFAGAQSTLPTTQSGYFRFVAADSAEHVLVTVSGTGNISPA